MPINPWCSLFISLDFISHQNERSQPVAHPRLRIAHSRWDLRVFFFFWGGLRGPIFLEGMGMGNKYQQKKSPRIKSAQKSQLEPFIHEFSSWLVKHGESFKLVLALCFFFKWSNWCCFEGSLFNCQILEFDWGQVCYKQGPSLGSLRTWENWEIWREETLPFKNENNIII